MRALLAVILLLPAEQAEGRIEVTFNEVSNPHNCFFLFSSSIRRAWDIASGGQQQFRNCVGPGGTCCDTHRFCAFWARNNECVKNPGWMRPNCQLSCRVCNPNTVTTQTLAPPMRLFSLGKCTQVVPVEVETRQVFSVAQMRARQQQMGCAEVQIPASCSVNECFHKSFRSIDGTCNNLANPIVGAAFTPFTRLLPSAYDDGINALIGATTRARPNPREVSMFLLSTRRAIGSKSNSMLMQFGQLISHDITKNALSNVCSCSSKGPRCANVPRPPTDPSRGSCVTFTRSIHVCGTGTFGRPREQYNENTAFIDGSSVYSSESVTLRSLRAGAMLRTHVVNGRTFPPNNRRDSMTVGDDRATIFIGLAAMHTTFLRLHNGIAADLQNMNRHWNQDRVFQETRKIVGSVMQAITYQEFLPALLGPFHARLVPPYVKYNPSVNPGILNEFAASAYRLHGMIQEGYPLIGPNFEDRGQISFLSGVGRIEQVLTAIDALYRGLIATPARSPQRITTSVTERLFGGMDMATLNIQRGRDHGLRPYNDYRKLCQLQPITSFHQWPEVTDKAVRERVAQLYRTPDDIDLYVGGTLEEPIEGSLVGPTFACIIAEQFVRLRDGDRFYFENKEVFTPAQIAALKAVTLSWVLCETGDRTVNWIINDVGVVYSLLHDEDCAKRFHD
ncbi:hypothetical protein RB195_017987 [Necator americanus]|uniref:ShKT domain-containing protein n=1 Tax=Necator americanus TaxID=51031 RepID=A0ABR1C7N8_NECAM